MGFINNYQYEDYSRVFDVADGDHTVTIMGAQVKQTQKGNQMLEVSLLVPDAGNMTYIERYVEGDYFNQNMSKFFDAFGIQAGNFNFSSWVKKSAKGHFIHKEETFLDKQGIQKKVNRCRMQYLIVPEKEQFPEDIPYQQNQPQQMSAQEQQGMNAAFNGQQAQAPQQGQWPLF
ncbi:MAG: hypothetical protein J6Y16_00550 [Treponema sp.]|nr:hypothetical protein [Treponema sp.]MBP5450705.1 hypothetical protein [Treponema sp.]